MAFEPAFAYDQWGEEVEYERPTVLPLADASAAGLAALDANAWENLEVARTTSLFQTPVEHFLLRAFQADGIDEIMAHMTTLEAAIGEEGDQRSGMRAKPDPHKGLSGTHRLAARIAGLLDEPAAAEAYIRLFDIRSTFVHGRAGLATISTPQRVLCRRLARRVAAALVAVAVPGCDRAAVLASALDRGRAWLPPT